jgi:hypothetical protein
MGFQNSGKSFALNGSVLGGMLKDSQGGYKYNELDLNPIIGNSNGASSSSSCVFVYALPHTLSLSYPLSHSRNTPYQSLVAFLLRDPSRLTPSSQLSGLFTWYGQDWTKTATKMKLDVRPDSVYLLASLQRDDGTWNDGAGLDISQYIQNYNGNFDLTAGNSGR